MRVVKKGRQSRTPLDPRLVILVVFSYAIWLFLAGDLARTAGVIAGFTLLLFIFVGDFSVLMRRLLGGLPSVVLIILLIWLLVPVSGEAWFTILGRDFTSAGFLRGATLGIRFLGLFLGSLFLYAVARPQNLAYALTWFLRPLRIVGLPIRQLEYVFWIVFRTIPVLSFEAITLKYAQQSRGAAFSGGLRKRLKAAISTIIPVFAAGIRRTDQFALALQARGFNPRHTSPNDKQSALGLVDGIVFLLLLSGWAVVCVSLF